MLKNSLRNNDITIRWGGEEFVILLQSLQSIETAKLVAESIRKKITTLKVADLEGFSCSFGVSHRYIKEYSDMDILFSEADKLLYKAKANGKNRVEV